MKIVFLVSFLGLLLSSCVRVPYPESNRLESGGFTFSAPSTVQVAKEVDLRISLRINLPEYSTLDVPYTLKFQYCLLKGDYISPNRTTSGNFTALCGAPEQPALPVVQEGVVATGQLKAAYTGVLAIGASKTFDFPAKVSFTQPGEYTIVAYFNLSNDSKIFGGLSNMDVRTQLITVN